MNRALILASIMGFSQMSLADNLNLGVFVGASLSRAYFQTATTPFLGSDNASGISYAGGLNLSFFQDKLFGLRLGASYININITKEPTTFTGYIVVPTATLNVNFDFGTNRHSLGFGAAFTPPAYSITRSTNVTASSVGDAGVVIEGKDWWKNGIFLMFQGIFYNTNVLVGSFSHSVLTLGYDF